MPSIIEVGEIKLILMKTINASLATFLLIFICNVNCYSQKERKGDNLTSINYEQVQYVKLIQPAFSKDYAGKNVQFEAIYFGLQNVNTDVPKDLKKHVRIMLCSNMSDGIGGIPNTENVYWNVFIPSEKSDPVYEFKQGQKILVKANIKAAKSTSGITGGTQSSILILIDTIEKIEK